MPRPTRHLPKFTRTHTAAGLGNTVETSLPAIARAVLTPPWLNVVLGMLRCTQCRGNEETQANLRVVRLASVMRPPGLHV